MSPGVLSQEELQAMLKQFMTEEGETFQLVALGYFGSYARQEAQPDSDIDIIFETRKANLLMTIRLQRALSDKFKRPVDLVRLHHNLSARFRDRIQREAVYV